jgi:hypothetical protein
VPDAQGALVEHLPGEGVGVSLEVVVGETAQEGDGAEEHHHEKGRECNAEGDAGRSQLFCEWDSHDRIVLQIAPRCSRKNETIFRGAQDPVKMKAPTRNGQGPSAQEMSQVVFQSAFA